MHQQRSIKHPKLPQILVSVLETHSEETAEITKLATFRCLKLTARLVHILVLNRCRQGSLGFFVLGFGSQILRLPVIDVEDGDPIDIPLDGCRRHCARGLHFEALIWWCLHGRLPAGELHGQCHRPVQAFF